MYNQFEGYDIPYNAICEFSAYLVIVYNDTNKMQRQGIVSFSVTGVRSFKFKENNVSSTIGQPLSELIPGSVLELIEAESEDLQLTGRVIDWTV
ncbi:hypothetical protein COA08_10175 [Bacillus cereus]|uniref:Uncharacterized protein n=1 Tax=Bacillus cereus TaxID=1396 RepID=A0A2C0EW84_BACCE|nr:hypothetical protein [Bacillus cereus]PDY82722.1 hypothetical protein CON06_10515 [Bacillus cereus]PFA10477.1 hypothetical protein CN382_20725 [Bacillus cereus]PFM42189.1 hypothetical protein COJ43_07520 [Bacillus cereus]PGL64247.1 hypothetical protein CN927_03525 [Bacillus cereus]PGQ10685.1 hypothetical protein COA08_10175 [Bacillus cereus]